MGTLPPERQTIPERTRTPQELQASIEEAQAMLESGRTQEGKPIGKAKRETLNRQIREAKAQLATSKAHAPAADRNASVLDRLDEKGRESEKWLKDNGFFGGGGTLGANRFADPEAIYHLARVLAGDVARGIRTVQQAAEEMLRLLREQHGDAAKWLSEVTLKREINRQLRDYEQLLPAPAGEPVSPLAQAIKRQGDVHQRDSAVDRLRRAAKREKGVGAPQNKRTVLTDAKGEFVVGRVTDQDWIKRVQASLSSAELKNARGWYRDLEGFFAQYYGEAEAPRMALAWLLANQNESPSGAMRNVLRVRDQLAGRPKAGYKAAGLAEEKVRAALSGQDVTAGFGAKLSDFVDSAMQKTTRTFMGDDPRGGAPAVIDVWANRDVGKVDAPLLAYLTKRFGEKAVRGLVLDGDLISETDYEYGSQFYNGLVRYLDAQGFDGGNWRAEEAQAVGWVAMQRAMEKAPEFPEHLISKNSRRVSVGLDLGEGAPLRQSGVTTIPQEQADWLFKSLADRFDVKILRQHSGLGAYLSWTEPSTHLQVLGSPEAVQDFSDAVGYAAQQTEVIATRPLKSGNAYSLDLVQTNGRELAADAERADLYRDLRAAGAPAEMIEGFQPIETSSGQPGLRFLKFKGKWSQAQIERFEAAVRKVLESRDYVLESTHGPVELVSKSNDWKEQADGQTYLQGLTDRGRRADAEWLGDQLRPSFTARLQRAQTGDRGIAAEGRPEAGLQAPGGPTAERPAAAIAPEGTLERLVAAGTESQNWLHKNTGLNDVTRIVQPEYVYHMTRAIAGDVARGLISVHDAALQIYTRLKQQFGNLAGLTAREIETQIQSHIEAATGGMPLSPRGVPAVASGPVTLGSGLGAFEPLFTESLAQARDLAHKRAAAKAAMDKVATTPEQQHAGEEARYYFNSENDLWAARANQVFDTGKRKLVPETLRREAVGIYREFATRRAELLQFLHGDHQAMIDHHFRVSELAAGSRTREEAQRFYDAAIDRLDALRPAMRLALDWIDSGLPAAEAALNKTYTQYASEALSEGQRLKFLESRWTPEEYVPHLFHKTGTGLEAQPASVHSKPSAIRHFFGFGQRRSDPYPTMLHGVADGLVPKTMDPAAAFTIHASDFARTRATNLLEEYLVSWGLGKQGDQSNVPDGWERYSEDSEEFTKTHAYVDEAGGEPKIARTHLFGPRFMVRALEPLTSKNVTPTWRIPNTEISFAQVRARQRDLKQAILGLSAYHLLTENKMAFVAIGPTGMWKALGADRDSPEFHALEQDFIAQGGTTPIQGSVMEAYRGLNPGSIPTRGEILRAGVPGFNTVLAVGDKVTRFTFDNVQRKLKVTTYGLLKAAWKRDNPDADWTQTDKATRGIASFVNGTYGGLHWSNMGLTPGQVEVLRAFLLAPDWSLSNMVLAKYALDDLKLNPKELFDLSVHGENAKALAGTLTLKEARTKEAVQAKLARWFWIKQMIYGIALTAGLSYLFAGRLHPDLTNADVPWWSKRKLRALTSVYLGEDKDGNDVTQQVAFGGNASDAINLLGQVMEKGPAGVGTFTAGKAAPFTRLALHLATGRDGRGRLIADPRLDDAPKLGRYLGLIAADLTPIPLSIRSGAGSMFDALSEDGGAQLGSERFLNLAGPQATHVAPFGMKMTDKGLRADRTVDKEKASAWEQMLKNRPFPSRRAR